MTILIQPASKDVCPQDLADLLWSTDPKLNGYMFGNMETLLKLIASEWPSDTGLFSHRQAFTATLADRIAGLLIGHTPDEYATHFAHSLIHQPAALDPKEAAHMETALHWMDRLFPAPRDGAYYVLEFAVSPQAQGQGVAVQLFNAAQAHARARNCSQICLDVAAENDAVGFYRHLGFRPEVETRVPVLDANHGIGTHLHMVFDLRDAN